MSEAEGHRSELEALKLQDPEFYKYLLETDKDLLDFQAGGSDSDQGDDGPLEVRFSLESCSSEAYDVLLAMESKRNMRFGIIRLNDCISLFQYGMTIVLQSSSKSSTCVRL